jgi:hypothetical protein
MKWAIRGGGCPFSVSVLEAACTASRQEVSTRNTICVQGATLQSPIVIGVIQGQPLSRRLPRPRPDQVQGCLALPPLRDL